MTQMPFKIELIKPNHCAVSPWEATSWASCCLTKGVKSKPPLERKSTSEWGNRQIQRQGTELENVVLRYRFLSLTPHPTWREKFLFKGRASEDPSVCATAAEGRYCLQEGEVDKNEGWENPVVFQSGSICDQECNTELTSPTAQQRHWNMLRLSRKVSKISPEKATAQKTIACELLWAQLWLQCNFPDVSILLWWESDLTL